jgi:hypothetical protein
MKREKGKKEADSSRGVKCEVSHRSGRLQG